MKNKYRFGTLLAAILCCGMNQISAQCSPPINAPVVNGFTYAPCVASNIFTLTSPGPSSLDVAWYQFPFGGNALNTGTLFTTPTITSGATYYVGQSSTVTTASVSLPAWVSSYSGNTRGMWFTAPTSFIITGLRVPTDAGTGNSNIAVMSFPSVPPAYPAVTNTFNLLYQNINSAGTGILPVYIPVNSGDVIGILGCRGAGTTANTSYGPASPIAATLGTYSLTLSRLGMQYPLPTTNPIDLWTESGGSLGRIEVYTNIGCLSPLTPVTVSVSPAPLINISGPAGSICSGANATLTASGPGVTSYTWAHNSSASQTEVVSPASTTIYTVSGSTSPTCSASSTISVVVNSGPPSLSVSASSNSICLGGTVSLTGSGANSYTWTGGVTNTVAFSPSSTNTYTLSGVNACGTTTTATTITVTPLPISATAPSTVICSTYVTTLTAGGATSYNWMPGNIAGSSVVVSPSSGTTYTVTGFQGLCMGTQTLLLATNPLPIASVATSNTTACTGDQITLTAGGGSSYNWYLTGNPSSASVVVTVTAPTLYSVAVTNSLGCTAIAQQVILTANTPTININSNFSTICNGNPVVLTASGASSYLWNNGSIATTFSDTPALTTVYSVTGTTGPCSATETITINVHTASVAITGPTAVCSGQSASLTASPASSYTWNNTFNTQGIIDNPVSTTIYSVNIIDNSAGIPCTASNSFQVIVNPNPTVSIASTASAICRGESFTLTALGANTYTWSDNSNGTSVSLTPTIITTLVYTLTGTNANGCTANASTNVKINACNSLFDYNNTPGITVYPNPGHDQVIIRYNSDLDIVVISELGQVVDRIRLNASNNHEIALTGLAKGIYFIKGQNKTVSVSSKLIIE